MILRFDTVHVQSQSHRHTAGDTRGNWQKTQFANLIRYVPSGTYYARVRVRGKLIVRSLKTDLVSVAKLRLADLEKEERQRGDTADLVQHGKVLVEDAIRVHLDRVKGDVSLKPRTRSYHAQQIKALLTSWPGLGSREIRRLTKTDCLNWAAGFGAKASASAFNHTAGILKTLIEIGIELGARYDNPARFIKRASERPKKLTLPTSTQFAKFLAEVEAGGARDSRNCGDLVRFLAYGGFRLSEAAGVMWADCDFEKDEIVVRGDPETGTKNWTVRRVPMISQMRSFLTDLKARRNPTEPGGFVMRVRECQKAMDRAARVVGMARITHHDLRHLFATRCIEAGVDIPTVSRWLGHKDGGALAMKTYGHLRDEHSASMAKKVRF